MQQNFLRLKKNEDRRLRLGHPWVYSNEVNTTITPLKNFIPGQEVIIEAHDKTPLGMAYINPNSLITARLFSRHLDDHLDVAFFVRKLLAAKKSRTQLFAKPFYRLVFGEGDELPGLVIDRFDETLVIQLNTAGMDTRKNDILMACSEVLPEIKHILFRNDTASRLQEGLSTEITVGLGTPAEKIFLEENGAKFQIPLLQGQKTGWFYDHRLNRLRLRDYIADRRVLDVFSYVGAWGIQAALAGASEVVCVDSSSLSEIYIKENAYLNAVENKLTILIEDAFKALKNLQTAKEKFDVIILDPPAFVKKAKDKKEGLLAYQRLNEMAFHLLESQGILISCSCSMHVSYDDLIQILRRSSFRAQTAFQILERGHQGPDHPLHPAIPETDYLKAIFTRKF